MPPLRSQHLSYAALQRLAQALQPLLVGAVLQQAFSQDKDELVAVFAHAERAPETTLRISCHPALSYVVPVQAFARARAHTVELFTPLLDQTVTAFSLLPGERILELSFANGLRWLWPLRAKHANLLLVDEHGDVLERFRSRLGEDDDTWQPPASPTPEAVLDSLPPDTALDALRAALPQFSKPYWQAVAALTPQHTPLQAARAVWQLATTGPLRIALKEDAAALELIADEANHADEHLPYEAIIPALQTWLKEHLRRAGISLQLTKLREPLEAQLTSTQKRLTSLQHTLRKLQQQRSQEELGNILLAYLHHVPEGATEVTLDDPYNAAEHVTIALKSELSPQANAERYFALHRATQQRLVDIDKELTALPERISQLEHALESLSAVADKKTLRAWQQTHTSLLARSPHKPTDDGPQLPYRTYHYLGWEIRVGKSARHNDALTLHHAHNNDLWLHAKDVPGSHVILRHKSGQPFPEEVIEYAAALAAFFSKQKHNSLAAVAYTPRKYVRKRKGFAPGMVSLEREEAILVEPLEPDG